MSSFHHIFRFHPRLIVAVAAGLLAGVAIPGSWQLVTKILSGWNAAVWTYLLLMGWVMTTASHQTVKKIAEQEDSSGGVILVMLSIAAGLSLIAIVFELASAKDLNSTIKLQHYAFTAITVIGSWFMLGTVYTFHYARLFYRSPETKRALRFPEDDLNPTYWDFLYFSFTIAVAAQTSDVAVMSQSMRKVVLAQSVLSFLFNAAIIGMSINIAAGLVGS